MDKITTDGIYTIDLKAPHGINPDTPALEMKGLYTISLHTEAGIVPLKVGLGGGAPGPQGDKGDQGDPGITILPTDAHINGGFF